MLAMLDRPKDRKATAERRQEMLDWFSTLLTEDDLSRMFGVRVLAVYVWRSKKNLPHLRFPGAGRDIVRFELPEVIAWAKKTGRKVDLNALKEGRK